MLKDKQKERRVRLDRARKRIRSKVHGTAERPRVHVFKSNRYVYTQAVDDVNHAVVASASTLEKSFREARRNAKNKDACGALGAVLAGKLKARNVGKIVFDRGDSPYHGRVKVLAEALRKEGLEF